MRQRLRAPIVLPCDPDCSVLRDAVVDIEDDGRIGYVGPLADAPGDEPVTQLSGILVPGLVNTHAHTPMTVLRGMGGDLPLLRWLQEVIWPAEERLSASDMAAGMLLGSVEMLRAGVTTSVEMYFHLDKLAEAVLRTGGRAVLTGGIIEAPGFEVRSLIDDISKLIDVEGLRFGPGDRIEIGYGPHSAYTLTPEILTEVAAAAHDRDALMHIHVAEAALEDPVQRAEHGSVPKLLESLGFYGGRVIAAHCVHLSDEDISIFARHGVAVAHCPGSNAKLASGIARVRDLREAGVTVGIGTDGPASNDDLDLWEEVRLAAMLSRLSTMDASALVAPDVLLMATRHGAAAIGRDDIGAIEQGRWADLVHISTDAPAFAAGVDVPDAQLLSNVVWAAGARQVADVWVAGDKVVEDFETTRVDRAEAQALAGAVTQRLLAGG
ncbi:amidohydrolase family protein [Kibdelosporangium phytohabitans]|uniref:Ethylammeline chlorohydrolase n=1 Tax=Kibdelosporangium phytohabitans TaxID=860235 RepID=A0A0N9ID83_9PSEU|nr:amidohydrolase [Kibdelosporangium phytohabitans]ALG14369.1 ethylammeline chlorohydrolase [Kibdelosporangium phytohabitans]MBE1466598.1 5-methylthioadenosine/S-adenosylhomocysteine deaminase [Kibdelosporangium phytohabitans]